MEEHGIEYIWTYSKTEESCWSPHIRISAMLRKDSTRRPRLLSETLVFFSRRPYKYLRCSRDRRFLGLFQLPPNQLLLRNIISANVYFFVCLIRNYPKNEQKRNFIKIYWKIYNFYKKSNKKGNSLLIKKRGQSINNYQLPIEKNT